MNPALITRDVKVKNEFLRKKELPIPKGIVYPIKDINIDILVTKTNTNFINNNSKTLILKVIEGKYLTNSINISPLLINDKRPNNEGRFIFGKEIATNDYNFPIEESVGSIQFKISDD